MVVAFVSFFFITSSLYLIILLGAGSFRVTRGEIDRRVRVPFRGRGRELVINVEVRTGAARV